MMDINIPNNTALAIVGLAAVGMVSYVNKTQKDLVKHLTEMHVQSHKDTLMVVAKMRMPSA